MPDLELGGELALDPASAVIHRLPRRRGNPIWPSAACFLSALATARPLPRLGRDPASARPLAPSTGLAGGATLRNLHIAAGQGFHWFIIVQGLGSSRGARRPPPPALLP